MKDTGIAYLLLIFLGPIGSRKRPEVQAEHAGRTGGSVDVSRQLVLWHVRRHRENPRPGK